MDRIHWYRGLTSHSDGTLFWIIDGELDATGNYYLLGGYRIFNATLSKFTGVKDLGGRDIYEKDIIVYNDISGKDIIGVVDWNSDMLQYHCHFSTFHVPLYTILNAIYVIGDVFTNPEFSLFCWGAAADRLYEQPAIISRTAQQCPI